MLRGQQTGALQQGPVQLQAQAAGDGDYSLNKPSLSSALTSSLRAPSSPTRACPDATVFTREDLINSSYHLGPLLKQGAENQLRLAYAERGFNGSGEPGISLVGIRPRLYPQGWVPLHLSVPTSLGGFIFSSMWWTRTHKAPLEPGLQQRQTHLLSGELQRKTFLHPFPAPPQQYRDSL